jgi:hypothetical protein
MSVSNYDRPPVSNGHPKEQALIRRWWHEVHAARGRLVWEYYLGDCYLDAMWFPDADETAAEYPGTSAPTRFPIAGATVVLCEAKLRLTPELVGQALMYGAFARRAGAEIRSMVIFAETGKAAFVSAAEELGLDVVLPGSRTAV